MKSLKLVIWYICLLRDIYKDYGSITYASKQTATVFEPRNLGPFSIIQKISSHAYKLTKVATVVSHSSGDRFTSDT